MYSSFLQQAPLYLSGMIFLGLSGAGPAGGRDRHHICYASSKVRKHISQARVDSLSLCSKPVKGDSPLCC